MEMLDILKELENRLNEVKPKLKELDDEVSACAKAVEEATKALGDAESRRTKIRNNVDSLEMALESLRMGQFDDLSAVVQQVVEAKKEEPPKAEEVKETKVELKKKKKDLVWLHKDAIVVQYDRHGNKMGHWRTQKAAARALGWSQSSVSHFMKFRSDEQIRKKNFYLAYEY